MRLLLRRLFARLKALFFPTRTTFPVLVCRLLDGKHPESAAFLYYCTEAGVAPDYRQASKWLNRYGAAYNNFKRREEAA